MQIIDANSVSDALGCGIDTLFDCGKEETSRNGKVIVAPGPVCTVYHKPWQRVLFSATRDANPFFHLMEALWMLTGRHDLEWPMYFNKKFENYSDDGITVWGAYGHRWRRWFNCDQLLIVIQELTANPNSRRAVLQMWDGMYDLDKARKGGKDVPCNTNAYFWISDGELHMTVCCRSNDIIWGAYGANAVHFSILQEYMAARLKVPMGKYYQFSNNFHCYTDIYDEAKLDKIRAECWQERYYDSIKNIHYPLASFETDFEVFDEEVANFLTMPLSVDSKIPFLRNVAVPMYASWHARKQKHGNGIRQAEMIEAPDWRRACVEWIERREHVKETA